MKRTNKIALAAAIALAFGLAGAATHAQPGGGWGPGAGCGFGAGYGMGYGMGYGGPMGPGFGRGMMGPGHGPGPGWGMGYPMGPRFGGGPVSGVLFGAPAEIAKRLDELKAALAISDSQQAVWSAFADSAKKEAASRQAWFDKMHENRAPLSTSEWLAQRSEAMKERQADISSLSSAYQKLYDALTPEQRSALDGTRVAMGPRYGARSR